MHYKATPIKKKVPEKGIFKGPSKEPQRPPYKKIPKGPSNGPPGDKAIPNMKAPLRTNSAKKTAPKRGKLR